MVLGYQKRYWWQLSSILGQVPWEGHSVPRIKLTCSVSENDPHYYWNERIEEVFADFYQMDLSFDVWPSDSQEFGKRGQIRTRNLQNASCDWVLFNDGDMVYHPTFFAKLGSMLPEYEDEGRILATWRMSMSFENGYKLVDSFDYTSGPVTDLMSRIESVQTWPAARGRISGAGFFQLVNVRKLREISEEQGQPLMYVGPEYKGDHNTFNSNHWTRSDKAFRSRFGGIVPLRDLPPSWHLNHYRKTDPQYPEGQVH